jgi:hypothetical protein
VCGGGDVAGGEEGKEEDDESAYFGLAYVHGAHVGTRKGLNLWLGLETNGGTSARRISRRLRICWDLPLAISHLELSSVREHVTDRKKRQR